MFGFKKLKKNTRKSKIKDKARVSINSFNMIKIQLILTLLYN